MHTACNRVCSISGTGAGFEFAPAAATFADAACAAQPITLVSEAGVCLNQAGAGGSGVDFVQNDHVAAELGDLYGIDNRY